jgi:rubredoxin
MAMQFPMMKFHVGGGMSRGRTMKQYFCGICAWVYDQTTGDPDNGINPGTPWEELPDNWVCPLCGVDKDKFFQIK